MNVHLLYPEEEYPEYSGYLGDYTPIIKGIGTILVRQDDDDYQGDTFVLLADENRFGFLNFGWGSCSGCDALQACESWKDVQELYDHLKSQIRWFDTTTEAIEFFETHDWKGDYDYSPRFVRMCIEVLKVITEGLALSPREYGEE